MRRAAAGLALFLLAVAAAPRGATAGRLEGSIPAALARLRPVGAAPADLRLAHVTVVLGLRDPAGLDAAIAAQEDPRSPAFGRQLDPTEIADRFGPPRAEYERVRRWLRAHGFTIQRDSPYRTFVVVAGTAGTVERTLKAPIRLFRHQGRTFFGPAAAPALPASIAASVRGVLGLDDLPHFRPLALLPDGSGGCTPGLPCTALAPADVAAVYRTAPLAAAGRTGAGRSIAVIARSNYDDADVALFAERFVPGRPLPVKRIASRDPGIASDLGEVTEVLIDAEWAGALAPGATVNVVIGSVDGDLFEALVKAVDERLGDVITLSFGLCESASRILAEVFDALYAIANAQGQTVVVASSDFGASDCLGSDPPERGLAVSGLASSSHAVAVGGTAFPLEADGSVPSNVVERVWNDGTFASGGGESILFARPAYQLGLGASGRPGRVLPDVALAGDPGLPGYVIVQDGRDQVTGGTSVGAPIFASMLALVNEVQGRNGLGQLLPSLYRLGSEQARGLRPPVFRDVTEGNNQIDASGGFAAGPGFDLASGWGAPLADALATAISGPGRCEGEVPCLVPAGGPRSQACAGEWLVEQELFAVRRNGIPLRVQTCHDGEAQCDTDGTVNGTCTMNVALCLNVFDFRRLTKKGLPVCPRRKIKGVRLLSPRAGKDPVAADNQRTLAAALGALPPLPSTLRAQCTATVPVRVPVSGGRRGVELKARVRTKRGTVRPAVRLRCVSP
ncbi:MAG TPA: S53 family peptidase [Candidatus Binatia bacterium]|nr:S53 family peptidase [Candidatus Binatia bacterium]